MFTGIIEKLVRIESVKRGSLALSDPFERGGAELGDSVAVNGVCLTIAGMKNGLLLFDASPETFSRTNLGTLKKGDYANAERALKAGSRVGGHFVSGHIDETGLFTGKEKSGDSYIFSFAVSNSVFLAEKGSVAVNGVSLTCYEIKNNSFKTAVIPRTFDNTNLKFLKKGAAVNVEFDLLAKYSLNRGAEVRSQGSGAGGQAKKFSKIDISFLKENGYL